MASRLVSARGLMAHMMVSAHARALSRNHHQHDERRANKHRAHLAQLTLAGPSRDSGRGSRAPRSFFTSKPAAPVARH
eukprot:36794-Prymnesium_polylepis.1